MNKDNNNNRCVIVQGGKCNNCEKLKGGGQQTVEREKERGEKKKGAHQKKPRPPRGLFPESSISFVEKSDKQAESSRICFAPFYLSWDFLSEQSLSCGLSLPSALPVAVEQPKCRVMPGIIYTHCVRLSPLAL
jgi:hypothetical protein